MPRGSESEWSDGDEERRILREVTPNDLFYGESVDGHKTSVVPGVTDKVYFTPL